MKARMKVTIVPNTVDAYVSGILIDDDLTPAITTLDGMVEQPSAVLRPLSGTLRWSLSTRIGMLRCFSRPTRWLIPIYKVMRQRILWRLKPSLSSIDLSIRAVVSMQFNLYVSIEYDAVWTELRTMTMS